MKIAYRTSYGTYFHGDIRNVLNSKKLDKYKNRVNLIFTSPPFPLNRKKKYGNLNGDEYLKWLTDIGKLLSEFLTDDGSIVIEIGNSWEKGLPTMSTLPLKSLLAFLSSSNYNLCQQFIWNNPAKLPSPAQWVNIDRVRVKDSFTNIWWMSKSPNPKANNKNILVEYSDSMKDLLKKKKYNSGKRPSEHNIGEKSFLKNNKGAIPSNVITAANTNSSTSYQKYCKENDLELHPARMPSALVEYFIKFLTDEGDIVMDPFGGSNTTGSVAEALKRNWLSFEVNKKYIIGSRGRFSNGVRTSTWLKKEMDGKTL